MNRFIILFITSLTAIFFASLNNSQNISHENKVVKIIKTSTYSTKPNFDTIAIGEPIYSMGYERLGIDFSWSIKYFDKYDNILKLERFRLGDTGVEIILETTALQTW